MIAFYPQIKQFHIVIALLSGALFALRGGFALAGARWPRAWPVKWLSYAIDTSLLTAAMMLLTILPGELYANGWLAVKLVLVAAYIVLGILAFRPQRGRAARWALVLAAGACFVQAYFIARFHHPLGVLQLLLG